MDASQRWGKIRRKNIARLKNDKHNRKKTLKRKGSIAVLAAILMIPMMAMVSFAIDYGYLLNVRAEMQRAADAAVLAAIQDLVPDDTGYQDLAAVRAVVKQYAADNIDHMSNFQVLDGDIEIGTFDTTTIYSNFTILSTGTFDTIRVTLRRDNTANSQIDLFFAPILGIDTSPVTVTATAILQKPSYLPPGAEILPFAIPLGDWNSMNMGDIWSIYGDGKMTDSSGNPIPGNWGTVDIGPTNNSTSDLSAQIINGLRQSDLNALQSDGRIPSSDYIDGSQPMWVQADPGLSSGIKSAVATTHGTTRLVPVFDNQMVAGGNNLEYRIVKWAAVEVVNSNFQGSKNTYVQIKKTYTYSGKLMPNPDLSNTDPKVEAVFTSPVLVQ